ncbi:hypothetical protein [Amycolatopsis decaplanina]|uniref:hypothetical protein n=1 Tax=Amycolatopsis decaplanina TaxID=208441 RepID=UPI000348B589|nr:hypothetical protein [Amycolatopsis decaplanina]
MVHGSGEHDRDDYRAKAGGGRRSGGVRGGLLLAGTVLFVPWAVHWGLLVP